MRILCVGISYRTAGVELRERLAMDPAAARGALEDLTRRWPGAEFLVLSTCNRTELYDCRPVHDHPREEELRRWLGEFRGAAQEDYQAALYVLVDAEAARHLITVAAGLDSLVPGEAQIVAQVKQAYAAARQAGAARQGMSHLVASALHAAKKIRTETGISAGKLSVASVAIDCVWRTFETLSDKCILNVGAGKMNLLMLRHLAKRRPGRILLANRSPQRAEQLAAQCGGEVVPWAALPDALASADVVLTSTGSEQCLITRAMVEQAQQRRGFKPLLIVDIAVPRDVEDQAGELENVSLYNIDDLEQVVRSTVRSRQGHQAAAERIIDRHVEKLLRSLKIRAVAPTIDDLYRLMARIADEELAEAVNKLSSHSDVKEDLKVLKRALHRTIRRILHPAASSLRSAAGSDAARAHVAAIRKLFGLDEQQK